MNRIHSLHLYISALTIPAAIAATIPARSQSFDPDVVIAETTYEDGSTNKWTKADMTAALGLLNRKYWRDMQSETGRREWHGAAVSSVIDTNALIRVTTYADGFSWTNKWTRPKSDIERAAEAAAARRAARRRILPPAAADIEDRRDTVAATTNTADVVIN